MPDKSWLRREMVLTPPAIRISPLLNSFMSVTTEIPSIVKHASAPDAVQKHAYYSTPYFPVPFLRTNFRGSFCYICRSPKGGETLRGK